MLAIPLPANLFIRHSDSPSSTQHCFDILPLDGSLEFAFDQHVFSVTFLSLFDYRPLLCFVFEPQLSLHLSTLLLCWFGFNMYRNYLFFLNGSNSLSHLRGFILDLSHFSICGARLVLMNGRWRCSDVGDSHAAQIFISLAMPPADSLAAYLAEIKSVINETMVIQYSIVVQYWSNSNVLLGST